MKVQHMAIIFLVIAIPLIIVVSYYLNLQQKTLTLQAEYDMKLSEATKEAIRGFEINTVEWSDKEGKKKTYINAREETEAIINTFITSLSNKLNLSGIAREHMLNYIPAIAVTLYDGYYIYSPTYTAINAENEKGLQLFDIGSDNTSTEEENGKNKILYVAIDGQGKSYNYEYKDSEDKIVTKEIQNLTTDISKAKKEYKYILDSKKLYSEGYTKGTTDVIVNYSLDNRIRVFGKTGNTGVDKEGYLVYFDNSTVFPSIIIPETAKKDTDIIVNNKLTDMIYNKTYIEPEVLEEQVVFFDGTEYQLKTFKYIFDVTHTKLYYDEELDNFFTINLSKERDFLDNSKSVRVGSSNCKYKSVSVLLGDKNTQSYKKIYQVLNGFDKGKWCLKLEGESNNEESEAVDTEIKKNTLKAMGLYTEEYNAIYKDFSSISYYTEAYAFTNWVKELLGGNVSRQKLEYKFNDATKRMQYENVLESCRGLFDFTEDNNPEKTTSYFVEHKKEVMKANVVSNLNLAISNYNKSGEYDFKLPVLTDKDWEKAFGNISMITFFQGVPIGLKTYNNYAIATSTNNREYVDPGQIYFSGEDEKYHNTLCEHIKENTVYTGYRSVEYVLKQYIVQPQDSKEEPRTINYYEHDNQENANSETECYYCIVNKGNYKETDDEEKRYWQIKSYNEALARERYYQEKKINGHIGLLITYDINLPIKGEVTGIKNIPDPQRTDIGIPTKISSLIPEAITNNQFIKFMFMGWSLEKDSIDSSGNIRIDFKPGDIITCKEDVTLYGVWKMVLHSLNWKKDVIWKGPEIWQWKGNGIEGSVSNIRILEKNDMWNGETSNTIVEMVGNTTNAGKGAMWATLNSDYFELKAFNFQYELICGCDIESVGFVFDIKEYDTYFTGYAVNIGKRLGRYTVGVSKIKYYKNKNYETIIKEEIKIVNSKNNYEGEEIYGKYTNGAVTINVTADGGYEIWSSDFEQNYLLPAYNNSPNSFGFFSNHVTGYKGCYHIGYAKFDNIRVTVKEK